MFCAEFCIRRLCHERERRKQDFRESDQDVLAVNPVCFNHMEQTLWPGWEPVRILGQGSFGVVYEIQRDVFGTVEKAALKVISIPQSDSDIEELRREGYDEDSITLRYQTMLEDMVREYTLMSELKGNSNVVDCDDLRYEPKPNGIGWNIYIKMELLTPMMDSLEGEIPVEEAVKVGLDICQALILCKKHNIIHRDIKPQNIFLSKHHEYKLGDFGIAKVSDRTASGTVTGTYKYMAPEVFKNQPYGATADIYSLGMVLYWMLNEKRLPFLPLPPQSPTVFEEGEARIRRLQGDPIPEPSHGTESLKQIVCKACAYEPEKRYRDPEEMRRDLEKVLSEEETVLVPKPIPPNNEYKQEKEELGDGHGQSPHWKAWIIAAILVAVVAGGAFLMKGALSTSPQYPSEDDVIADATSLLRKSNITGDILDVSVLDTEENKSYQTYTCNCEAYIQQSSSKRIYEIELIYEQEGDAWEVSSLSKTKRVN